MSISAFIFGYAFGINLFTFLAYGIDKLKAKRGWWRIPESTLLILALIGGSIGAWIGIYAWRHKTQHLKFKYGVPIILLLQTALFIYIYLNT